MDWIQTISIIATVIGTGYYIHREVQEDIRTTNSRIDNANARTDRLYEMFLEAQKENHQRFYDLLKERR